MTKNTANAKQLFTVPFPPPLLLTSVPTSNVGGAPSTAHSAILCSSPQAPRPTSAQRSRFPMDFPRLVRRLSSYSLDGENNNPLASVAPTSARTTGLTVDTSVAKTASFRTTPHSRDPTPSSTRSESNQSNESEHVLRRRRSNSECLMLAKTNGTQDLPGPCKEYISSVKQILARSSEESRPAARRRSMSMRHNPAINEGLIH